MRAQDILRGNRVIEGGHAVMLQIPQSTLTERLRSRAFADNLPVCTYGEDSPASLRGTLLPEVKVPDPADYHLTLQFVGRDLRAEEVGSMLMLTVSLPPLPVVVRFTGEFEVFRTRKGSYVVALVEPSAELSAAKVQVKTQLISGLLKIKDDFKFRPHVTLLEAGPDRRLVAPDPVEPFEVRCTELEIKYGKRRMVVDL